MSEPDAVAEALRESLRLFAAGFISSYDGIADDFEHAAECLADAFAEMWDEERTVRTVDELDALPVGTVIRGNAGVVAQSVARPGGQAPAWVGIGCRGRATSDEIPLPARVLGLGAVNR